MAVSVAEREGVVEVLARGSLTIGTARDLADAVRGAMEGSQRVSIRFEHVDDVDLTLVQILCAACRMAAERSMELVLEGDTPPLIRSLLQEAGGERVAPCRHNAGISCVWFGGTR